MAFGVFLTGGLLSALLLWYRIMAAVWGVTNPPSLYIAFFASLGLTLSAFIALLKPSSGRVAAACCIIVMGLAYLPAFAAVVPLAHINQSLVAFVIPGSYVALLAFALFRPHRFRYSVPLFAIVVTVGIGFAAATYVQRLNAGTLHSTSMVFFEWAPADRLTIQEHSFDTKTRAVLSKLGVRGTLEFSAGVGELGTEPRIIVLCRGPITEPHPLPLPKHGTIVHLFDGEQWQTFPAAASAYSTNATLRTDGMVEESNEFGRTYSHAFSWK